jgi:hypothetical protein
VGAKQRSRWEGLTCSESELQATLEVAASLATSLLRQRPPSIGAKGDQGKATDTDRTSSGGA